MLGDSVKEIPASEAYRRIVPYGIAPAVGRQATWSERH
jgi:hypothetical protein